MPYQVEMPSVSMVTLANEIIACRPGEFCQMGPRASLASTYAAVEIPLGIW
ncbi:hypothetical protein MFFC18_05710 [Mariniblastus fucicola]|uniref:Uncharacterized protein n=1 Tax=Mariniblastus fucicola TaxID=980251 RepID=A0A5B9P708_9BACT|nr:hypothetical protein MFFC18_05710 [Mariniblastus fucicola]